MASTASAPPINPGCGDSGGGVSWPHCNEKSRKQGYAVGGSLVGLVRLTTAFIFQSSARGPCLRLYTQAFTATAKRKEHWSRSMRRMTVSCGLIRSTTRQNLRCTYHFVLICSFFHRACFFCLICNHGLTRKKKRKRAT